MLSPLTVLLGVAVFFQPQPSAAQPAAVLAPYWSMVREYAHGDRAAATTDAQSFSERDLDSTYKSIMRTSAAARQAMLIRAAILLHAERERMDRRTAVEKSGGELDCSVGRHGLMAQRLLKAALEARDGEAFVSRFLIAQSLRQRALLCFANARYLAELGLKSSPKDPLLHFAAGLAHESLGTFGTPHSVALGYRDSQSQRTAISGPSERKEEVNRGRDKYQETLSLDPGLVEARLRLGRVQWKTGRSDEARANLKKAAAEADGPLLYLARLFLGQCLEDAGDVEGAVREYRSAVATDPQRQTASVALAHALVLQGDSAGAREILSAALSHSGRRIGEDAYWFYFVGNPLVGEGLLERLKADLAK